MSTSTHQMTAAELIDLPDDGHRYELVKGVLLTMTASGADHGMVTAKVAFLLHNYIEAKKLGFVFAAGTGFKLESDPDTVLAPDFAFIRRERNPPRSTGYAEMAPDLAVEVNSCTKNRAYVERKAAQWLSFGVQSVWLVSCQNRTVEVLSTNGTRVLFTESDELTDEDMLPGFRVRVAEIFN
jgi:Uma2 family endonuclease